MGFDRLVFSLQNTLDYGEYVCRVFRRLERRSGPSPSILVDETLPVSTQKMDRIPTSILRLRGSHLSTALRARFEHFGTDLTVLSLMGFALLGTGLTRLGAHFRKGSTVRRIAGHESGV